jgi:IclR family acetate operon transcriptional repressor
MENPDGGGHIVTIKIDRHLRIPGTPVAGVAKDGSKSLPKAGRTIQSVDRALTLLELAARELDGITLSELSERAGLNASTCHHLIMTLVARGYLTHLSRSRGYALGPKVGELLEALEHESDPAVLLREDLRRLGQQLGLGVQLAVLSETSLLTKISFPGPSSSMHEPSEVEKMTALHATATGKAILAWIPDTELVRIISANGLKSYTPNTITTLSGIVEELRTVRRFKYAIDNEELREGVVCIGSAIREGGGAVVASISATMPAQDASEDRKAELIRQMIEAANTFSNKLRNAQR